MSLRLKLVLLSSGAIAGALALSVGLQTVFERRELRAAQERRHADKVRALAKVCEQALAENSQRYLEAHAALLAETEPLASVSLRDESGVVLFSKTGAGAAGGRKVAAPVGGESALTLEADFDAAALDREADAVVAAGLKRQLAVSFLSLLAGVLGAAALSGTLTRPLTALLAGAQRVGGGDFSLRLPVSSADEVGRLSEEFNRMAARLGELDAMKQGFFETVTHDLRNPLVSVRGYLELFLAGSFGPVTDTQREKLEVSLRSTLRLNSMIDDFLDSSKLQAGTLPVELKAGSLSEVAADAVESLSGAAAEHRIALSCEVPDDLPRVSMDQEYVRRVLVNLVGNALNFTPDGGKVWVRAAKHGDAVRVVVEDTGVGIPAGAESRLFERFYQAPETREAARSKGTGLGLFICKGLVEAQGGDVGAERRPEGGSRFWFRLRLA